ncbi:MAG: hypothetical protein SGJ09_03730 [Phycisphaerae bacterium]|nr:hypothetical protein [Phycisphaerae bacterium]
MSKLLPASRWSPLGWGIAATVLAVTALASAQASEPRVSPPKPASERPLEGSDPAKDAKSMKSAEVLEVEGLGLSFRPPQPAFGKAETIDGVLRYEVVDGQASPRWWLRFQNLTSSKSSQTARSQLDAYLDTLRRNAKPFTVKVNEDIVVKGASGESRILLIETPIGVPDGGAASGSTSATGINGWIIIPNGIDRFLTGSIIATSAEFDAMWPGLKTALASIEVKSLDAIALAKQERIDRGEEVLAFSMKTLRAALSPEPTFYRMYRPGAPRRDGTPGDEIEIGWMSVRVVEGQRGEVDPTRDVSKLRGEDTERGLLSIIDAKSIVSSDATNSVDSQIRSWVAWDRRTEVWSVRSTQRQGTAARSSAQTGLRSASPPKLQVINAVADRNYSRDPQEWVVPPNYLSQAELVVLGRLLPKNKREATTFASYAFEPKSNGLPQRTDTWKPNEDGTWTLDTRVGGSTAPLVQTFDANGDRVKRVDVDSSGMLVTERIALEQLRSLWKRKGLPIE